MPKRIQRKRVKGWRLPDGSRCVTRPGTFGNPFSTAAEFRKSLIVFFGEGEDMMDAKEFSQMAAIVLRLEELRGLDLACFCPLDKPCHADVLIEFANR